MRRRGRERGCQSSLEDESGGGNEEEEEPEEEEEEGKSALSFPNRVE